METYQFKEINDKGVWNDVASKFEYATFIDSWEWGEFQRSIGFQFLNIGVFEDGKVVGLLPITIVDAKRGSYLHLRHSPLIDWRDEGLVHEVVVYLRDLAKENGSWFVRVSPLIPENEDNRDLLNLFSFKPSMAHEVDAEHTLVLDLTKDEDRLLSEMRKNTRYSIRKAAKMGVEVEVYTDLSKFEDFWTIFDDAVARNQWVAYSKEYVKKEFEIFSKDENCAMFLSKYEGKYISAAIFTYFNGQSVYHHSGSLTEYRKIPSTYLLQWEAIKYAKSKGLSEHNLWGVVDKDDKAHPWYGLSLFKWGFGGDERLMIHAHDLLTSPLGNATRVYEYIESKRHGY